MIGHIIFAILHLYILIELPQKILLLFTISTHLLYLALYQSVLALRDIRGSLLKDSKEGSFDALNVKNEDIKALIMIFVLLSLIGLFFVVNF